MKKQTKEERQAIIEAGKQPCPVKDWRIGLTQEEIAFEEQHAKDLDELAEIFGYENVYL